MVFTNELGHFVVPYTANKRFKSIVTKLGRPDARFHDLRYVEKIAEIPTKKVAENPEGRQDFDESRAVSFSENLATICSVADLYNFVKSFDKDFTTAPEISPVVAKYLLNEDATPRMFDHTTDDGNSIKVFKNGAGKSRSRHRKFYP